ncbi:MULTISPECIES: MerR family transcriptional regulator [Thermoactinomyces]|uniref:MerR family transcriptional regulator n=1 Tax=Thermoactinomyces daqus TaxID=1329516 RepID=A0A7W2AGH1_9BACL|nr:MULTISPECIES: MerR family transcriptional regulator [Thermoactinomyces]MBA4542202.1 MerR family transcriptional regulator [Thermoactinomyces daqus]MBH8598347.1 MerR family transcriptional regulator [Thermoactinomyces sp. CICC 10523]MBH8604471.1 MerR family transcriptional regulator [Thermoactinomyces sp. CICC 10522]MBH8607528.1 MerR family transcriptional regulator [Thermoactinomyces sp. CICC 10521]
MNWYKIDDVAKITGLTKRTLRYYEEIGLIPPPERSDGKIRLYTDEDIEQIRRVLIAKEVLGFSLQELQQFLHLKKMIEQNHTEYGSFGPEELLEIKKHLSGQIHMLHAKIERMQKFTQELTELQQKIKVQLNQFAKEDE